MFVDENRDRFPVGMRILAVDDDPVCLKLLENLLLRCEYHVTTTNQAIAALKMLRENKDKFDLVISDVHMPDMDGFKLLELVGLEMDLPVIMLSINGETQSVMKGITHGACDYLLKPVRIEELRNIWQHVVRKKKVGSKGPNNLASDSGQGSGSAERIGKFNKRRKDQTEEEEGTCEENETGNDDSTNQKKARVVWSVDLHRKFVAAVNYLGVDKAVPKKILDLMNVERLTRENVASHLQKYRLYLKRISSVANQANIFATFGGKDSYLPMMSSLDGFRDHHPLSRSGPLTNAALTSLQSGGALNSLNFPSSVGLHGLLPQENVQLGSSSVNSVSEMGGIQEVMFSENKPSNLLHGIPTSMEPNLDENKSLSCPAGLSNLGIDSPVFSNVQEQLIESGSFADNKMVTDFCMNSFSVSNPLVLQGQPQKIECKIMCNQSSLKVPFLNADSREPIEGVPSSISGHSNNSRSRQDDNMLTQLISNSLSFDTSCLSKSWPNADVSEAQFSLHDAMSRTLPGHLNSGSTISISHLPQNNVKSLSNSGRFGNNQMQNVNFCFKQKMGQYAQDASDDSNLPSIDTIVSNHLGQKFGRVNKMDATIIDHTGSRSLVFHNGEVQKSNTNDSIQSNQFSLPQGPLRFNSYGTLGDLNNILKRERDDFTLLDGDIGCDIYPLGTCI